jgi:hypothetical protein
LWVASTSCNEFWNLMEVHFKGPYLLGNYPMPRTYLLF